MQKDKIIHFSVRGVIMVTFIIDYEQSICQMRSY